MTPQPKSTTCPGCGCPRAEYTPGCSRCSNRHSRWRKQGHPDAKDPIPAKTHCAKCGYPLDKTNPDCDACRKRAYSRAKREGRKADVPPRTRPKPRKTEDEIRATTEHNRRALDAWLQARRARLNTTPPAPREPISTDTADLISENRAVELTGCTRTAIRNAVKAGTLQCLEVHKPMSTKRFFSRAEVTAWATNHQKDE